MFCHHLQGQNEWGNYILPIHGCLPTTLYDVITQKIIVWWCFSNRGQDLEPEKEANVCDCPAYVGNLRRVSADFCQHPAPAGSSYKNRKKNKSGTFLS
jgi:hypothetical protein